MLSDMTVDSMMDGLYGDHIEAGISTFTASMLAAMSSNNWVRIEDIFVQYCTS